MAAGAGERSARIKRRDHAPARTSLHISALSEGVRPATLLAAQLGAPAAAVGLGRAGGELGTAAEDVGARDGPREDAFLTAEVAGAHGRAAARCQAARANAR